MCRGPGRRAIRQRVRGLRCTVSVNYLRFAQAATEERRGDLLRLHGPQTLKITVHRDGATDISKVWEINEVPSAGGGAAAPTPAEVTKVYTDRAKTGVKLEPAGAQETPTPANATQPDASGDFIALPVPRDDDKGSGPYLVDVSVAVKESAGTPYHDGVASTLGDGELPVRPQLTFTTRLNSRGPFGWHCCVRTFISIPVEVTGLRFPARAAELTSSAQSPRLQLITPRVGVLLGVEPWDYNAGKSALPIGLRFLGGFHLIKIGEKEPVAVSTLLGGALTLPLVESPTQLGTSLALGVYWENDLRDRFKDGNHLLVTLGVNVLNLLGSK